MLPDALEQLIRPLVDFPDDITIEVSDTPRGRLLQVIVNPEDMGRVIGRNGKIASSLRSVIQAIARERIRIDIIDVPID